MSKIGIVSSSPDLKATTTTTTPGTTTAAAATVTERAMKNVRENFGAIWKNKGTSTKEATSDKEKEKEWHRHLPHQPHFQHRSSVQLATSGSNSKNVIIYMVLVIALILAVSNLLQASVATIVSKRNIEPAQTVGTDGCLDRPTTSFPEAARNNNTEMESLKIRLTKADTGAAGAGDAGAGTTASADTIGSKNPASNDSNKNDAAAPTTRDRDDDDDGVVDDRDTDKKNGEENETKKEERNDTEKDKKQEKNDNSVVERFDPRPRNFNIAFVGDSITRYQYLPEFGVLFNIRTMVRES